MLGRRFLSLFLFLSFLYPSLQLSLSTLLCSKVFLCTNHGNYLYPSLLCDHVSSKVSLSLSLQLSGTFLSLSTLLPFPTIEPQRFSSTHPCNFLPPHLSSQRFSSTHPCNFLPPHLSSQRFFSIPPLQLSLYPSLLSDSGSSKIFLSRTLWNFYLSIDPPPS